MDEFKEFENNNETNPAEAQPETNSWEPVQETTEPAVTPEFVSGTPVNNGGSNGMAIASMVLGIVAIVFNCCFAWISFPCAIIGVILGGISLSKKQCGKGMAIAGVVLSILSLIGAIVVLAMGSALLTSGVLEGLY